MGAVLARTWGLDGLPVAFLEVVPAHGSASTLLVILKAVSLSPPRWSGNKLTDLFVLVAKVVAACFP